MGEFFRSCENERDERIMKENLCVADNHRAVPLCGRELAGEEDQAISAEDEEESGSKFVKGNPGFRLGDSFFPFR